MPDDQEIVWAPVGIDISTPHPARVYDYYLDGKDNFQADRVLAEKVLVAAPEARLMARENRAFLRRAVRFLVTEAGIRQFIDIGTGIPTAGNVHEIAQAIAPDSRIVYVDNDPIVLNHARALLTSTPQGCTAYIDADLRDPGTILALPELLSTLDLTQPVALLMIAVLHFVRDEENPYTIVKTLLDALPVGSYLALSHATADLRSDAAAQVVAAYSDATSTLNLRTHSEISSFFAGCALVDPGLVQIPRWRQPDPPDDHEWVWIYGGVGRKSTT